MPKITEAQYLKLFKKHTDQMNKHSQALYTGPNALHPKIFNETRNAMYKKTGVYPMQDAVEKNMKKHKQYPAYKKHLDGYRAAEAARNKAHKDFSMPSKSAAKIPTYAARMELIAAEKKMEVGKLPRKFHRTMMRFHKREGNHHLSIENTMMDKANACRKKSNSLTPEGEAYKQLAEKHANMVQYHANKYQTHRNHIKATPEGRKKGSK